MTKGVVKAERSLTSEFNYELAGAIICAVEEVDIAKAPGAHAKIKEYSTGRTILIRKMRHDSFEQPNTTHWVQTANKRENCPVFPGDTRITAVYVGDLLEEQKIAKPKMEAFLDQEAPHFLHTLMHLELPPDHRPIAAARGDDRQQASSRGGEPDRPWSNSSRNVASRRRTRHTLLQRVFRPLSAMAPRQRKARLDKEIRRQDLPVRHNTVTATTT